MSEHTPTPWRYDGDGFYGDGEDAFLWGWDDGGLVGMDQRQADADVKFIVCAVNAHDALVAAAEKALYEMCHTVAPRNSFTDAVDALDAALTLAR